MSPANYKFAGFFVPQPKLGNPNGGARRAHEKKRRTFIAGYSGRFKFKAKEQA